MNADYVASDASRSATPQRASGPQRHTMHGADDNAACHAGGDPTGGGNAGGRVHPPTPRCPPPRGTVGAKTLWRLCAHCRHSRATGACLKPDIQRGPKVNLSPVQRKQRHAKNTKGQGSSLTKIPHRGKNKRGSVLDENPGSNLSRNQQEGVEFMADGVGPWAGSRTSANWSGMAADSRVRGHPVQMSEPAKGQYRPLLFLTGFADRPCSVSACN